MSFKRNPCLAYSSILNPPALGGRSLSLSLRSSASSVQDVNVVIFEQESLHEIELIGVIREGITPKLLLLGSRLSLCLHNHDGGRRERDIFLGSSRGRVTGTTFNWLC